MGRTVDLKQTHTLGFFFLDGKGRDDQIGIHFFSHAKEARIVHVIEMIACENQKIVKRRLLKILKVLPDGIGRPIVPHLLHKRLFRADEVDLGIARMVNGIRLHDMLVEKLRKILRDDVNVINPAIEGVRQRDIDEAVFASEAHGGFAARLCQGEKACALAAC